MALYVISLFLESLNSFFFISENKHMKLFRVGAREEMGGAGDMGNNMVKMYDKKRK